MLLLVQIAIITLCLTAVAFFAGIETGIISINRLRLMHRARNGSKSARIIEGFLRETDRLLGTTLVGSNLANVVVATLSAAIAEAYWGRDAQILSGFVVAMTILIFGEYLPKAWFASRPLERCLPLARMLRLVEILLKPLATSIMLLTQWSAPKSRKSKGTQFVTREHLHLLTRDSEAGGQISTFERLMISRVLDMQVKTAAEVMTPISKVAHIFDDATTAEAIDCVRTKGHMKIPVFTADYTRCTGVIYMQDVLANMLESNQEPIARHLKPPFFIADTTRADDVLPLLRRNRQHLALIRNADGRILGIVTLENILKILVGNLPATATGDRKADRTAAIVATPQPLQPSGS